MLAPDVVRLAEALLAQHLPGRGWTFAFDRAVRRAGACHHVERRITLSRHLAERAEEDEVRQVLLHEVAHALAGHRAAHGPRWRARAAAIGYTGSRLHDRPIAEDRATWVGTCPAGHEHRRFRRPTRETSCGLCSRRFSRASLIAWRPAAVEVR
ncbi:SprT-like domain-containing protein [Amnibacterium setariae]|uniref:M48 family peptidase n=1 Tax=Amnibacterium setariae TaxID=2306585 RepID=A0A3A1U043_9MICO|nr:SprT-like domain-containing protein [Amnibacterium setariae]RIX30264.1 M48 family peptidase [Amnibacterium setariae]